MTKHLALLFLLQAGAVWANTAPPVSSDAGQGVLTQPEDFPTFDAKHADEMARADESTGWVVLSWLLALGIVVLSIYLSLHFGLRKLMGLKGFSGGRGRLLSVVEKLPLDPRKSLYVVKAANDYWVVGVADESMSHIGSLPRDEVDALRKQAESQEVVLSPLLEKILTRKKKTPPPNG